MNINLEKLAVMHKEAITPMADAMERERLADRARQFAKLDADVAAGRITPESSMLKRKEIIMGTSSANPANMPFRRRMHHRFVKPVKRFFSGPMGKAKGIGILGGLAGLGYLWSKGRETPEEKARAAGEEMPQEEPQYYPQQMGYYEQGYPPTMGALGKYSASTSWAFSAEVPNTPQPVKQPKNPGAPNSLALAHDIDAGKEPGRTDTATGGGAMGGGGESSKLGFLDSGALPLAGGLLGGGAGYLLGSKVISPMADRKVKDIEEQLRRGIRAQNTLKKISKGAPLAAAAIGAILLAGLAATHAKKKKEEAVNAPGAADAYAASQYGFSPNERYHIRDPRARMY